jgi:hypothetical protein
MTRNGRWIVTMVVAAVVYTAPAIAQTQPESGHKFLYPHASRQAELIARIDALDERIALLTSDMRVLTGELKIEAMANLIEALIERQTLIDRWLEPLRNWIPRSAQDDEELDPEVMCSPFI